MADRSSPASPLVTIAAVAVAVAVVLSLVAEGCGDSRPVSANPSSSVTETTSAASPEPVHQPDLIRIKYRDTPVDVADPGFEYWDTSSSSFVDAAWYDNVKQYLIINLNGTHYHYCRFPASAWRSFTVASSYGRHFNSEIEGRYDCRLGGVPNY